MPSLKAYSTELPYSYAAGVYPSMRLMEKAPRLAQRLLLSDKAAGEGIEKLKRLCAEHGVREEIAPKALARILGKENVYAAVVFEKQSNPLDKDKPHIVLHHPMDEGNLGAVQRTMLGFGLNDLAVIRPAADPFDPRVVRASMGALFGLHMAEFDSFEAYRAAYPAHALYPFMLDGAMELAQAAAEKQTPWALVFGSEGAGLPPEFGELGQAVRIHQSDEIDSYNLAVSAAIAGYIFTR
ncbi:MAG: TrmH family RNA methyltransferase [Clostridiales bacterium]|nr:TrmH family RNA methyltransferase [Clostridiales bacterium]